MSSAPVAALLVALTLSAVLLVSGAAKLRDPRATSDAFLALRVPEVLPAGPASAMLPWLEIVLAVLLLAAPAGWAWVPAAAVLLLMVAYTALVARALTFDEAVSCSCFGSLGRHEIDRTTVGRNALLTLLAAVVTVLALDGWSTPSTLTSLTSDGWWTLAAAAALAAVAVLVVGGGPSGSRPPPWVDDELLEYAREPVPYGVLSYTDGRSATLMELSMTQARLVVILNAGCGPCLRTAAKLDAWAEQLAPAVSVLAVYPDVAAATLATGHDNAMSTWEPELNVRRILAASVPAAVLLGADGLLAGGPVDGEDEIAAFVTEVIDEVRGGVGEASTP